MKKIKFEYIDKNDQEVMLQTLVDGSDKNDLAQCIRLISLYISLYKMHFGELPAECYEDLFMSENKENSSTDIFENGLTEAIAMLDMIIKTSPGSLPYTPAKLTIN